MITLISHAFLLIICLLLKAFGVEHTTIGIIFSLSSAVILSYSIISLKDIDKKLKILLLIGLALRIILVFVDTNIARLPDTGTDDDNFFSASVTIYESEPADTNLDGLYGGLYSKVLPLLYVFVGPDRFSAQYLNVIFSVLATILLIKAFKKLGAKNAKIQIATFLMLFMPYAIIINSILRRESIIELFLCLSVYLFSIWYTSGKKICAIATILSFIAAALFHTALLFGVPILITFFMLYDRKKNSVSLTLTRSWKTLIVLLCILFLGILFLGAYNNKFSSFSDTSDIYNAVSKTRGGSAYLTGYTITNTKQLILFAPLKLLYFLISPAPWDCRNIVDLITFILDATVYIALIFAVFVKNKKTCTSGLFFLIFASLSLLYSLGTFTSGTAIRHRLTVLPFLLVAYCMSKRKRRTESEAKENDDEEEASLI